MPATHSVALLFAFLSHEGVWSKMMYRLLPFELGPCGVIVHLTIQLDVCTQVKCIARHWQHTGAGYLQSDMVVGPGWCTDLQVMVHGQQVLVVSVGTGCIFGCGNMWRSCLVQVQVHPGPGDRSEVTLKIGWDIAVAVPHTPRFHKDRVV